MVNIWIDFRAVLQQELKQRQRLNNRYSFRAFARQMGLSPARLSEVLNGRYGLSRNSAQKIALQLGYSEHQAALFCDLVECEHARSNARRAEAQNRIETQRKIVRRASRKRILQLNVGDEIALFGKADYNAVARFLKKRGAVPFRSPEMGGAASIALVVRRSRVSYDSGPAYFEFSGLILVANVLSTPGYSIYVFTHLTDSPAVLESRRETFETVPRLCGRIKLGDGAEVEDENGQVLIRFKIPNLTQIKTVRGRKFSMFRNGRTKDGRVARTRVSGISFIVKKPFRKKTDSLYVQVETSLYRFLKRVTFEPHEWNFSESRFDYFKSQ